MHCHCFYYLSVIVLNSSLVYLMNPGPFLALSDFSFDFRIFFIIQKYSFLTFSSFPTSEICQLLIYLSSFILLRL